MSSFNEWDPLEEVIVGVVDGAAIPAWHTIYRAVLPDPAQVREYDRIAAMQRDGGALPYPPQSVQAANRQLDEFVRILEGEGVVVRRPEAVDHARGFATPAWSVLNGFSAANPRDVLLVVGDEIIEAPMADRGRYFEAWPYRPLLKEYFRAGARWTAAPRPQLLDPLFEPDAEAHAAEDGVRFATTEFEPTFDAADFVRCGRDIFAQRSHVTNESGIAWLQRHLGSGFRIHTVETRCRHPFHIDTTLVPLAPGKMLVNPEFVDVAKLPRILRSWDLLTAPDPDPSPRFLGGAETMSQWVNMNVLSLDEERVVVERSQASTIRALKQWGFKPIPCAFECYYPFMGSFHCATLDVRRRGELRSYF
ncbi:MAG TPA: hypothetical protein VHG51_04110 [Longimicrobiaceae bacterium]|nr:hypothetical protein [Longimicrobiaceae bacterium]